MIYQSNQQPAIYHFSQVPIVCRVCAMMEVINIGSHGRHSHTTHLTGNGRHSSTSGIGSHFSWVKGHLHNNKNIGKEMNEVGSSLQAIVDLWEYQPVFRWFFSFYRIFSEFFREDWSAVTVKFMMIHKELEESKGMAHSTIHLAINHSSGWIYSTNLSDTKGYSLIELPTVGCFFFRPAVRWIFFLPSLKNKTLSLWHQWMSRHLSFLHSKCWMVGSPRVVHGHSLGIKGITLRMAPWHLHLFQGF